MNRWIKRGIKLSLFLIAFNTIEHLCHKQTKGFFLQRIQFQDEQPQASTPNGITLSVLNQPFHYFSHGNQCFAFASEDGKYILKFFKYVHPPSPLWTAKIPLVSRFKALRQTRIDKALWKRNRDFQGYQIAFDRFRSETGLLDIHLHPTTTYPTITLYDPLNIVHSLDLNQTPFILQKRTTPIYEQFFSWIEKGEIDALKQGISDLTSLCKARISKQIFDDDVNFYSNFGFCEGKPIQIDPGHFNLNFASSPELPSLFAELKEWFSNNYPSMVTYVEDCALSQ
ncbi:MAG TPA: hypothetical protein VFU89_06640 [Rhabdochlamydiaceae bacterium]|nr:hypothetical protein [Rhabdochlamydiaceae bacterium]